MKRLNILDIFYSCEPKLKTERNFYSIGSVIVDKDKTYFLRKDSEACNRTSTLLS